MKVYVDNRAEEYIKSKSGASSIYIIITRIGSG